MQADSLQPAVPSRQPLPATVPPSQAAAYTGPTYYGRSPIKRSKYGALIWSYTYLAGLAGGAQILATIADLFRRPRLKSVVRNGRLLALVGPTVGSALLVADLHTPGRWYNMLRIFRPTSPMSIGSYILSAFGIASGITAAAELFGNASWLRWLRPAAKIAQLPAAAAGAGMCTYTGALLAATSTPAWAATPRLLPARFACSSIATAAAALSLGERLWGDSRNAATLDLIALGATLADAALSSAAERACRAEGIADSGQGANSIAAERQLSGMLEHALPLLCYGVGGLLPRRSSQALSIVGALGVLAGGLLMRSSILDAGNRSADRAEDYLALTQAGKAAALAQR